MEAVLAGDSCAVAYEKTRRLVYQTVREFHRRYGGDFDELLSLTNEKFLVAFDYWDRKRKFSTWVRYRLWLNMFEIVRTGCRQRQRNPRVPMPEVTSLPPSCFEVEEFLLDLSRDAREMVTLVLEDCLDTDAKEMGGRPKDWGIMLRRYLKAAGWSVERITESWNEISEALQ